jgi:non-specific serine/threonine protein kinase
MGLEADVLGWLGELVDKSLLQRQSAGDEPRVGMLETVREFALEQLAAAGELPELERRHAEYYLALAEAAEQHLMGPEQRVWLDRLAAEHDNLRAVLRWSTREDDRRALGARLAGALMGFWWIHGHWREGLQWLEEMSTDDTRVPPSTRAKVLNGAGVLAEALGHLGPASDLYAQSLALCEALDDRRGMCLAQIGLGAVAMHQGASIRARAMLERSLTLGREQEAQSLVAHALVNLGAALRLSSPSLARIRAICSAYLPPAKHGA